MLYDCLIIGAGPAGLSAAVQLARFEHKLLVFEKRKVGGLLNNANRVENYLGFLDYSGPELIREFKKNLKKTSIRMEAVEEIHQNKSGVFSVKTPKKTYTAQTILLATGTEPNRLQISHKKTWEGKKLFYDLVDFPFRAGKTVLILGGGDVGFDYALNLKRRGLHPVLWTHRKTTCLSILKKRAKIAQIPYFEERQLLKIQENGKKLTIHSSKSSICVDYVLVAIGRHAAPASLRIQKPLKGLYSAGDVNHETTRQVQIAAGEGIYEALKIHDYLIHHANRPGKRK